MCLAKKERDNNERAKQNLAHLREQIASEFSAQLSKPAKFGFYIQLSDSMIEEMRKHLDSNSIEVALSFNGKVRYLTFEELKRFMLGE